MVFSIISSCLGKVKLSSDNSNLIILVDVQNLHENNNHVYCVSNGVYTLFRKGSCSFTLLYQNVSFPAGLKHHRFFMVYQFLSRVPRIGSSKFLFVWLKNTAISKSSKFTISFLSKPTSSSSAITTFCKSSLPDFISYFLP